MRPSVTFTMMQRLTEIIYRLFVVYAALIVVIPPSNAEQAITQEYIKASYLINLSQFIYIENNPNIEHICIIGTPELNAHVTQILKETGLSNKLKTSQLDWSSDFSLCQLLYISETAELKLKQILYKASTRQIITVSDVNSFIHQGGAIGFSELDSTITITINHTLLKEKGISVSSELLEIAREVL